MPDSSSNVSEAKSSTVEETKTTKNPKKSKSLRSRWHAMQEKKKAAQAEGPPPATAKNFFRVLKFGNRNDKILMWICGINSLAAGVAMPLMFLILGTLVNNFTGYFTPGSGVTKSMFMHSVSKNALIIFGLFWARFVFSYISMYCVRVSGLRISANLRLAYIQALFRQPQAVVDAVPAGTIASRITASSNTIQMGISQQFAIFLQALSLIIGAYIVSFAKAWLLTFVASAMLPFILIVYGIILPYFIKWFTDANRYGEQAAALSFEILTSIRIVAAFCAEGKLSAKHREFLDRKYVSERKIAPLLGLAFSIPTFCSFATFALTFYFGIKQYRNGHLGSVGDIVTVQFSIMMSLMSFTQLIGPLIQMSKVASSAADILATIDMDFPDKSGLKEPDVSAEHNIGVRNVSFAYPSRRNVQVLDQVNMTFEARKTTAIVGPSGSGKSTIVGLLQRWYDLDDYRVPKELLPVEKNPVTGKSIENEKDKDKEIEVEKVPEALVAADAESSMPPIRGQIFVGNVDLSTVDAKWWRAQIGLVQQEPFLFNDTIYTNVAYGLCETPYADLPDAEKERMVEDACRLAFADEFITRLPQGYRTIVGESGIKMSGGQRQRIAIARAVIKKPTILILDEATSAIDVRTEKIVQAALDRASEGRTTIVIAHRLATIKKADKIIVLRKGQVMEEGTHYELLKNEDGIYSGLVRAQNIAMGAEEDREEEAEEIKDERPELTKTKSLRGTDAPVQHDGIMTADGLVAGYKPLGFLRAFALILNEQKRLWPVYTLTLIACCVAGAAYPLQAFIFAKIINTFTITDLNKLQSRANFWALMFFILACAMFVAYYVIAWATHHIGTNVTRVYRQEYLSNILRKRIAFFDAEGNSAGTLSSRLATDPGQIEMVMGAQMGMAYVSVFNLIGSLIISFYYGWKLALVSTCVILPVLVSAGYLRVKLELKFEKMNAAIFEESSQFATEAVSAFRTVSSLILEDTIVSRYDALLLGHVKVATVKSVTWTLVFAFSNSAEMICQAFMLWYGGTLLASHEYGLEQYFVVFQAILQGGMAAGIWFSFAPNIANATAGANRILSSRHAPPELEHEPKDAQPTTGSPAITFNDVHFSYKSRDLSVLSGIDLSIKPGQFVALVGATGCGKSTIISLLERFYDATKGAVTYNDHNITDLSVPSYRANLSLVAQESTLYEGSVRENVCLSVPTSTSRSAAEIEAAMLNACRAAQIHEFVASLPEGYATRLGPKGVSLSGGQRQRLALARALMREPRVLLLDEATSSLDSEAERLVQEAIERAALGGGEDREEDEEESDGLGKEADVRDGKGRRRTVIAVAHRLATIQKADVIFVIGSGKVLEKGSHAELLAKRGVYYSMCQAQALDR